MSCNIFSCLKTIKSSHLLFPDLSVFDEVVDGICLLCKTGLDNKVVKCNLCNRVIGHLSCVKKWLKNNKKCPYCNQNFINF